jgi:hypothetical protein
MLVLILHRSGLRRRVISSGFSVPDRRSMQLPEGTTTRVSSRRENHAPSARRLKMHRTRFGPSIAILAAIVVASIVPSTEAQWRTSPGVGKGNIFTGEFAVPRPKPNLFPPPTIKPHPTIKWFPPPTIKPHPTIKWFPPPTIKPHTTIKRFPHHTSWGLSGPVTRPPVNTSATARTPLPTVEPPGNSKPPQPAKDPPLVDLGSLKPPPAIRKIDLAKLTAGNRCVRCHVNSSTGSVSMVKASHQDMQLLATAQKIAAGLPDGQPGGDATTPEMTRLFQDALKQPEGKAALPKSFKIPGWGAEAPGRQAASRTRIVIPEPGNTPAGTRATPTLPLPPPKRSQQVSQQH